MKKNLVKLLAIAAVACSLGSCGKDGGSSSSNQPDASSESSEVVETPVVVDIEEFYAVELDDDNMPYAVNQGKLVTLEGIVPFAKAGVKSFGYYPVDSNYLKDIRGVEFYLADGVELQQENYRDSVNLTGRIDYVNNHCVLRDCEMETVISDERQGISWTSEMDRSMWTTYAEGFNLHGCLTGVTFQLCSLPTFVEGEEAEFYGVFGGENPDLEDVENYSPIRVVIPAEVSTYSTYETFFADKEVGDGVYVEGVLYYSSYGIEIVMAEPQAAIEEAELEVMVTWEDVKAAWGSKFARALPEIGQDSLVFSYTVTDYYDYAPSEFFEDSSFANLPANDSNYGVVTFNYVAKPKDLLTIGNNVLDILDAEGSEWTFDETNSSQYEFIYNRFENEGDTVALDTLILVAPSEGESQISVYYLAEKVLSPEVVKNFEVATGIATAIDAEGFEEIMGVDEYGDPFIYVDDASEYTDAATAQGVYEWANSFIPEEYDVDEAFAYDEEYDIYYAYYADEEGFVIDLYVIPNYDESGETVVCYSVEFDVYFVGIDDGGYAICMQICSLIAKTFGAVAYDNNWEQYGIIFCGGYFNPTVQTIESMKTLAPTLLPKNSDGSQLFVLVEDFTYDEESELYTATYFAESIEVAVEISVGTVTDEDGTFTFLQYVVYPAVAE